MKEGRVRHGGSAYRALGLALAALTLAGCGGSDGGGAGAPTTATGPTELTVRDYDGDRLVRTTELDCAVRGGACDAVVALLPRLAPDPGEVCTQIYGGPERRVVTGTVTGRRVSVEVTRANGCQIARYDLLGEALRS